MVTAYTTTDRVTLSPSTFQVSLDLNLPSTFLSFYRLLVRNAERLLNDYQLAQQKLATAQEKPATGIRGWLRKRAYLRDLHRERRKGMG